MVKICFNFIFLEKNLNLPLIVSGNWHWIAMENDSFGGDSSMFLSVYGFEKAFWEGERAGDGRCKWGIFANYDGGFDAFWR